MRMAEYLKLRPFEVFLMSVVCLFPASALAQVDHEKGILADF